MQNLAYAIVLILFAGAAWAGLSARAAAKWIASAVALVAFVVALALAYVFLAAGAPALTVDLVNIGSAAVLGVTIDKVSMLIGLAVVRVGFLIWSIRPPISAPTTGNTRYCAAQVFLLLLAFIGSMAGLVYSSTMLGQLLFFEMTGVCSWALIAYYQDANGAQSRLQSDAC